MATLRTLDFDRLEKWLFIGMFLLIVFIYAVFPTKSIYWDGIFFAQAIEDVSGIDANLFHPNHLFYNVIGYSAFQATRSIGFPVRAIFVLQTISIFFGALCTIVFFLILKSSTRSTYLSLVLTALFAFSATWWKFATDASAYIPSIFFLLVSFYLILPDRSPRPLLVAVTHSLAMFFHELAVFFFPVVILGLVFQTTSLERKRRTFLVVSYGFGVFLLVFGTYVTCFYLLSGTFEIKSFVSWITFYTTENGFSWDIWKNFQLTSRGHRQLFFNAGSGFQPREPLNVILMIVLAASVFLFIIKFGKNLRDFKTAWQTFREQKIYIHPITLLCITWIVPYLLFLYFFIPANTFYRLFYFPALILLIGMAIVPYELLQPIRQWRLAFFALLVCLSNFLFYIRPHSEVRKNTPLAFALRANEIWSSKTVVFYNILDTDNRIVKYFTPAVVWKPLNSITLEEFEREIHAIHNEGGNVWLDATAVRQVAATEQSEQWSTVNMSKDLNAELALPGYDIKYTRLVPLSSGEANSAF